MSLSPDLPVAPRRPPASNAGTPAVQWHPEGALFTLVTRYARAPLNHRCKVRFLRWSAGILSRRIMRFERTDGRIQLCIGDWVDWAVLTQGVYEAQSMALALRCTSADQEGAFLDVGAHHGIYSIAIGAATRRRVIAIEPSPVNFQALAANLRLNPSSRIQLVNCCASAQATLLELSTERPGRMAWTRVVAASQAIQSLLMPGLPLDLLLDRLNVDAIKLLKIDVEGYEAEVFRGLTWDGPRRPEFVLMECDPHETEKLNYLIDRGYAPQTVDGKSIANLPRFPEGNLFFTDRSRHEPALLAPDAAHQFPTDG